MICEQVRVTKHAHEQYCTRVEVTPYLQLNELCQKQLDERDYYYKKGFIHLSGVWWVFEREGSTMALITCYGRSDMDLPRALGWAAMHRDRINLETWRG